MPLFLLLLTTKKSPQPQLDSCVLDVYKYWWDLLSAFSPPGGTVPGLSAFPHTGDAPYSLNIFVALHWALPTRSLYFLELRSPELDTVLQMWPHHGTAEGEDHLLWPAGHTLYNAPQDITGVLGHKNTVGSLLLPSRAVPDLYWCSQLFLPTCKTPHLFLWNLTGFLSAQLSSPSRAHWMAAPPSHVPATPHSSVSSANLLRVDSNPSARSLMKMIMSFYFSTLICQEMMNCSNCPECTASSSWG